MPFDSPDVNLGDLLEEVATGETQLPDFQREWKWDTDLIASLLASISMGYPVGVVMMLEVGDGSVNFLPRPISGVELPQGAELEKLILDGQQRLTSLFQALYSAKPVETKDTRGKKLRRWFYLYMAKSLDPDGDREEAIIPVPEDKILRNFRGEPIEGKDYSTIEKECGAEMFPLWRVFDGPALDQWMVAYLQLDADDMPQRLQRWSHFKDTVLKNITSYTVPVIILNKETPKEAVCTVFEKVNTGGIALNVFELLTATFAAENFRLNDDWKDRKSRLAEYRALRSVVNTDFLQTVSLLATYERRQTYLSQGQDPSRAPGISCKRKEILRLTLEEFQKWMEPVTQALIWAASFLASEQIFQAPDLPYRTQLVPLAAIRVVLGPQAEVYGATDKLRQWYWCGVLGELYGGTTESRFARDLDEVVDWVKGGQPPNTVAEATFNPSRLLTLRTRNSAAYKGVYALLMKDGCRDWLYDKSVDMASFFNDRLDIHHIFPKDWCNKPQHGVDPGRRESIVNKTAISYKTNRKIGGKAPSEYIPKVEKEGQLSAERLDDILRTHMIDPSLLRSDDFNNFFEARSKALLTLIAAAMGKEVLEAAPQDTPSDFEEEPPEPEDEGPLELVEAAS